MALKILVTGGTFDKEYDEITGKLYFRETHIKTLRYSGEGSGNIRLTIQPPLAAQLLCFLVFFAFSR